MNSEPYFPFIRSCESTYKAAVDIQAFSFFCIFGRMGSARAAAAQCHPAEHQQELKSETKTKTLITERVFVNLHWCFKGLQNEGRLSQSKAFFFWFSLGTLKQNCFVTSLKLTMLQNECKISILHN